MAEDNSTQFLLDKIAQLENELRSVKKYGLVWDKEKVPEKIVSDCIDNIPVLSHVSEKDVNQGGIEHLIIEGDNFQSLLCLKMTDQELFDFIYIDPPYNLGKSDFKYNDKYVEVEDTYRHSKWLNMMEKRLTLARSLMKPEASIFISIDDHECFDLKLLCDQIFGASNFVALLPTIMNLKGNNSETGFAGTHEYTLVYSKTYPPYLGEYPLSDDELDSEWKQDKNGYYKRGAILKATGSDDKRSDRAFCFYPFLIRGNKLSMITEEEYRSLYNPDTKEFNDDNLHQLEKKYNELGYGLIIPKTKTGYGRWRWAYGTACKDLDKIIVEASPKNVTLYKRQGPEIGDFPTKKPKSVFYKPEYSSGNGTNQLEKVIGPNDFNNPKPLQLIKDFITIGCPPGGSVLDFFAGSGTTAQAVLELNNEDKMSNRKFTILQCSENGIIDTVTYPRVKTVLTGQRADGTTYGKPMKASIHYYRAETIPRDSNTDQSKYNLVTKVDSLLCIMEETYNVVEIADNYAHYTSSDHLKHTLIYNDYYSESPFESFKKIVLSTPGNKVVYVFSLDNSVDKTLFGEMPDVVVKPIPSKIFEIYQEVTECLKRGD